MKRNVEHRPLAHSVYNSKFLFISNWLSAICPLLPRQYNNSCFGVVHTCLLYLSTPFRTFLCLRPNPIFPTKVSFRHNKWVLRSYSLVTQDSSSGFRCPHRLKKSSEERSSCIIYLTTYVINNPILHPLLIMCQEFVKLVSKCEHLSKFAAFLLKSSRIHWLSSGTLHRNR